MGRIRSALLAKFIYVPASLHINRTTIAERISEKTAQDIIKGCCKVLSIPNDRTCNLDDLCTLVENHIITMMSCDDPFHWGFHNTIDSLMMITALWLSLIHI